jgi:hypothetical protein
MATLMQKIKITNERAEFVTLWLEPGVRIMACLRMMNLKS